MNTYTLEQVQEHNKPNDCWIIVDTHIYDVTEFALSHPGGKQLLYSVTVMAETIIAPSTLQIHPL